MRSKRYQLGVDCGGTFTDCVVIDALGRPAQGKAASTPEDFSIGMLNSIEYAAKSLGLSLRSLLESADVLVHGTTVATNALLTGSGARVGLIVTKGFEDTVLIGRVRQKVAGLREEEIIHAVRLDKPEPLVPRTMIRGVTERIDYKGKVIVPLSREEVVQAIKDLVDKGVEAIGVCLLWSFVNTGHEQEIKKIASELYPDMFVVLSSELTPKIGEYERMATTMMNCYLGPVVSKYIETLEQKFSHLGLGSPFLITQVMGGAFPAKEVKQKSVNTLSSGPVCGVTAAGFLGNILGYEKIICTDVGGTSFDVGLIIDGREQYSRVPIVGQYHLSIPMIDIVSIGTGGGSIAWIEQVTHVLRVGPRSAGAHPGPACYDRGGEEPTLTDAGVVLGYINPDFFLGGRMKLNKEKAISAVKEKIADPLHMKIAEAAFGSGCGH